MIPHPKLQGLGGLKWLNLTQFGGALNDNFLKLAIIYALGLWWVGADEKEMLGLVGMAFAIPFLLFLGLGGNLADKFSKAKIAQWAKFFEVVVALSAVLAFYSQNVWSLFAVAFLMSTQSAIFSPVKYGIIPELAGQAGIARANGLIQAATYIAIIGGTLLAPAVSSASGQNFLLMGLIACLIALGGWVCSLGLPRTPRGGKVSTVSPLILPDVLKAMKYVHRDGFLTLAVWASAYFSFVAGFAQLNLLSYGTEHLLLQSKESSTWLFLFIALGIGAGSILAGKASRNSIEFGIVPIGAFLVAACSLALGLLAEGDFLVASLLCGVLGLGAGLFIVPVESFIQFRTDPSRRGEIIAASGWLSWVGILLASGLVFLLPKLGLTAAGGFLLVGGLVVILFGFAMYHLPDFLVRFFVMLLTRIYYRLNVAGQGNVPAQGPALLVANHASLMDAACLLAGQPRRIRFLMDREYLQTSAWFVRMLFNLMGVIPVCTKGSPKEVVKALQAARKALEEEWLVGIFPEGTLSRTGHMLPFKRGYQKIVKGTGAPIVPAYIDGAYGTRASYAYARPIPLSCQDFRHTMGLVFGVPVENSIEPKELQEKVRELADQASMLRGQSTGSLGCCFARVARSRWSTPAISDSSGKSLTYGKLLSAAVAVGAKLDRLISPREAVVGVMLPPSVAGVIVNLSLTMLRRPTANLNYTSSLEALQAAIQVGTLQTVVTSRRFLEKLDRTIPVPNCIYIEDVLQSLTWRERAGAMLMARWLPLGLLAPQEGWHPDELLTVLFSSGSTALPKGIMLSHRNVSSNIDAFSSIARVQQDDCILGVLPLFHSMGYTTTMWFPLLRGVRACYHHHPLECDQIEQLCAEQGVSIVIGTPTFMLAWVRRIAPSAMRRLRWACAGAEKMRPKLASMFESRFGLRPMEGYGTTECSPVVSANVPDVEVDGVCQRGCKEGSAGKPVPNVICRVVDQDTGLPVPIGQPGLLLVRGPSVMLGYLGNATKTSEVLKDGWYNTGDIAMIDEEGFVTITDRLSRFSKIGGEMVSHTAVEDAIKKAAGAALNTSSLGLAVTGLPDEKKGEKLVVLYEQSSMQVDSIQAMVLAADMPNLWKPAKDNWIPIEEIPVLGTGKLDLARLKLLAKEALP
jgi:acyl-[acyl-carrier-protein]-phospholipid O-acyltransferase/long-chain-fatty-acid--[acyl-carrier-protein] ligase